MQFPIDDVLAEIVATLAEHTGAVLQAPPGAGKTTRVPPALLGASWLGDRKIIMLEPRRLAARAAATFMAQQMGEAVGQTVGYRIRFDTRVSARTRIEVVTEGVLTRILQSDPALEEYGVVIFDEFHERSLNADVGLALTLQSRELLREELRIIAMSATLDGAAVAKLLGDAPIITSEGRAFPVETVYLPNATVPRAVQIALRETEGDVLAFLPGAAEISRALEDLTSAVDASTYVVPLYGNLSQSEQDLAIAPSAPGRRKVVLATSIAETSLTIEGVRAVVDSGVMRVARFDARIGMTRLDTITVSRASADQRRGRAGRVAPGICYRLWSEPEDAGLVPHTRPEILEADLLPVALDLAAWGINDPAELTWLDEPPASSFAQAREILYELGAIDHAGNITAHGRKMAELPVHPRVAHMLLRARDLGHGALAAELAVQLGNRPSERRIPQHEVDQIKRMLGVRDTRRDVSATGLLLAFAYPDRIGRMRGRRGKFVLRNGRGAFVDEADILAGEEYIVAAELQGGGRDSRVYYGAAFSEAELREHFGEQIERVTSVELNSAGNVSAVVREQLGAIVLKESHTRDIDPDAVADVLWKDIEARGIDALPWTKASAQLRDRMSFMHATDPDNWAKPDLDALRPTLHARLTQARGRADIDKLDLHEILLSTLSWQQRKELDQLAPTHIQVPSGSNIHIDYANPEAPFAAVRLQEVFGMKETPKLGGRVPLTLQLLSPAQRPVQVTRDLASFWQSGYFEVKKELKGKYPKHYWPDDPLIAEATRRARPR